MRAPMLLNKPLAIALLGFVVLGAQACTSSSRATAHYPEPSAGSLRYEQVDEMVDDLLRFHERTLSVELRRSSRRERLSGPQALEALATLKKDWTLGDTYDRYIRALLARPDSLAVHVEFPEDPSLPKGMIFIPWPLDDGSFRKPPDGDDSPGAFLMLGTASRRPDLARGRFPTPAEMPAWPQLDHTTFDELMVSRSSFVTIIHSAGCPGSDGVLRSLATALAAVSAPPAVMVDVDGQTTGDTVRELVGGLLTFPTLVFYSGGDIIDIQIGAHQSEPVTAVNHFLSRNGVGVQSPGLASDYRELAAQPDGIRTLALIRHLPAANLDFADLEGIRLKGGSLSGSSLKGANLRNADLRSSVLSHANLEGADLTGAKLDGAFWRATICPDGRRSEEAGGTCVATGQSR